MIIARQISLTGPVALCPGFWPIAVKLSSHHDFCRFSANVPAAAWLHAWWSTAMTMRNFRIRDRVVLQDQCPNPTVVCTFEKTASRRFMMYLYCRKQVK